MSQGNTKEEKTGRRRHFLVKGVVQGVGFRPFVYGLALRHGLTGWVNNSSAGVHIEVEGDPREIERFTGELSAQSPPRARIEAVSFDDLPPAGFSSFAIRESSEEAGKYQLVSPDIATCEECRREIFTPGNRRYRYPFTNCTNCGPRFTIIQEIPYDRPRTTMAPFRMCPACRREYEDPLDRRFHAQPNGCPECGPRLELWGRDGKHVGTDDPIAAAIGLLREGRIVAIKGLGGFLLACDGRKTSAVEELRRRKNRPHKPLAVMLADPAAAREHCFVDSVEEKLLLAPESSIVLLRRREISSISSAVAPSQRDLGVMLPYTPLHHLLLRESKMALVMTSGNRSEEPIARENGEAVARLAGIADGFLVHNRDIHVQYDDSVTAVINGQPAVLRRSRGYAPFPIRLPFPAKPILACGAELKNTFCLTRDRYAFVSQHIGDMENLETLTHFQRTLEIYQKLFRIEPEWIACDLHPNYLASRLARRLPGRKIAVQHHFAHMASCLAENGASGPVIGLSFDGLGYGTDGHLWGGEFLVGDYAAFERAAHFEYLPLPGGEAAIRNPWRMALSALTTLLGREQLMRRLRFFPSIPGEQIRLVLQQIDRKINTPLTSSCGRLFDAVSALLGLCSSVSYEGQAAMELEAAADPEERGVYDFTVAAGRPEVIQLAPFLAGILADLEEGAGRAAVAARFHNTLVRIGVEVCGRIRKRGGPRTVTLSGGVFQNRRLLTGTKTALEREGFTVLVHRLVPCNDGGLSLGQAAIANFIS